MPKTTTKKTTTKRSAAGKASKKTTPARKPAAKPAKGRGGTASRAKAPTPAQTPAAEPAAHAAATAPTAAPKRMTCLDAAHAVLVRRNKPMRITDIMAEMVDRELWASPAGLTPDSTLSSAMLRDMKKYGEASRFRRVDRGFYAAREHSA